MTNTYLELLRELGIDIPEADWNRIHGIEPEPTRPKHPSNREPLYVDETDGIPVYTASQLEWNLPEHDGVVDYRVVEDDYHAHPFALNYHDELYYRANYRPRHRYSRPYRIRWTLSHLIGSTGKLPPGVADRLRNTLPPPGDVLHSRSAHEWVRTCLKKWRHTELYLSVPYIVARLGGPRWRVSSRQVRDVYDDAIRLHTVFDTLRKQGRLGRQRFPKLQYVLLKLLDRHGVVPPYRIPWARTSIKRRQLRDFLTTLDANKTPWILPEETNAPVDGMSTPPQNGDAGSAIGPAPSSNLFCNATSLSSANPAPSSPPTITTVPAESATTPTAKEDSTCATIPF